LEVPYSRSDDVTKIDIIEEIGRLHGFNNFLTTLPKIKQSAMRTLVMKLVRK
jgi:phenylalanyl-tRNA synthetase beta subunit